MPHACIRTELPLNAAPPRLVAEIIPLRQDILPRHREYLARWLEAGQRMGLCDADIDSDRRPGWGEVASQIVVWVRENADPAYTIRPQGMRWVLVDQIREHEIASYRSLEAALNAIRPVLPLPDYAAA